ncbi:MAG: metal ABC transporter ATP-binding protein [Marmoricola sp.]
MLTPRSSGPVLEISRAAVSLGGRPILRHIDLAVGQGDVVALLGANGSGKSTLVRTAVGLHPLRQGEVRLFGTPLASYDEWQRVGYVPQRAPAATGVPATVWEVVASGRLSRRRLLLPLGRHDRAVIREAIDTVGLGDRAGHPVSTLSGGQQQRVLMARALAGEPELLFLDEPNAGVDLVSQEQITRTLAERAAAGATLVVVLHELGPFAPLIHRAVVLREGRLVYDGSPGGVLDSHDHAHHDEGPDASEFLPGVRSPLEGGR